jgi:flavin-dependent dehydrogenase
LKPLSRTYADRILVVGSAAGQAKPITGGGVYYGLLCADIAADCLHRALESDNLSSRNLAAYQKEWKKKLGREIAVSYRARKFYERLSDRQIDRIFDIVRSAGIDKTLLDAEDLSFDWHGGVVMKLIGHGAISQVLGALRVPFTRKPER